MYRNTYIFIYVCVGVCVSEADIGNLSYVSYDN